jgi:TPR repeat protein
MHAARCSLIALSIALASPALAQPAKPAAKVDIAFGAYQRGHFLTALKEANELAAKNDPQAMTLIAEIYANGLGVGRDDAKAAQWYQRAADLGDPQAMFALAIFKFSGRGGPQDQAAGVKLFESAAKAGNLFASYNLGLLCLRGQGVPKDLARAARLFEVAARGGVPEAQYALATLYREGRGVTKDEKRAMQLMQRAAAADNLDAMVEFAIAEFNGNDTKKDESAAAQMLLDAARRGSPIAQNRVARLLSAGRGVPANPVQAMKWHIIARTDGRGDPDLDAYMARQKPEDRDAAEKAAKLWLASAKPHQTTAHP